MLELPLEVEPRWAMLADLDDTINKGQIDRQTDRWFDIQIGYR